MIVIALLVLAMVLLVVGAEMFLVMGIPTLLIKHQFFAGLPDLIVGQRLIGGVEVVTLMAIPFFIFAAEIMAKGRMANDLGTLVRVMVGSVRGGIAYSTVIGNMAFGAASGSAPATVAAMGRMAYPELRKNGYSEKFSLGLIASSAECALLIPPSISFVVYSWLTGTSIAKLFAAGLGIGIVLGLAFMVLATIETVRNKIDVPSETASGERLAAIGRALWVIGLQTIMMGGIFGGFFTATEAAAVSVVYAAVVEVLVLRSISLRDFYAIAKSSAVSTSVIFILLAMGSLLAYFLTLSGVDAWVLRQIKESGIHWAFFLLLVNVVFVIAGMFLDPNSMMLIFLPTLFPVAVALGVDPVHFGVIVVMNVCIGMITPPFGLDLFVTAGTLRRPVEAVIAGIAPFVVANLVTLALVSYIPELSTTLPRLMGL